MCMVVVMVMMMMMMTGVVTVAVLVVVLPMPMLRVPGMSVVTRVGVVVPGGAIVGPIRVLFTAFSVYVTT